MATQAIELERRAANLASAIRGIAPAADCPVRAHKLLAAASKHSEQVETGYRRACASSSPDEFIQGISSVATNAKRTTASLMLLVQLGYVPVPEIRELILEARGLENIFVTSRNTAKRRLRKRVNQFRRPPRRA